MEFRPSILLVDDDETMLQTLSSVLAKTCNTVTVISAKQAFEYLKTQEPHTVLTDFQMPEINGVEFLTEVKKTYPYLPIILITGSDQREVAIQALRAGAYDYLAKPISAKDLKFAVERAVKHRMLEFEKEILLRRIKKRCTEVTDSLSEIITCCSEGLGNVNIDSKNELFSRIINITRVIKEKVN